MKNTVATMDDLAERIRELEAVEVRQMAEVKAQITVVVRGLRPSSLIKGAIGEIAGSSSVKHAAIDTSLGLGAGMLARKLFTLNSKNIFRKLLGYGIQYITTNIVTKKLPEMRERAAEL